MREVPLLSNFMHQEMESWGAPNHLSKTQIQSVCLQSSGFEALGNMAWTGGPVGESADHKGIFMESVCHLILPSVLMAYPPFLWPCEP